MDDFDDPEEINDNLGGSPYLGICIFTCGLDGDGYGHGNVLKVSRTASEPVPKFTDHEITEFETNEPVQKESAGTSYRTDDHDGFINGASPSHTTPSQSQLQSQSHSHSHSTTNSCSNKNAQSLISPLSPLSENMQNIILSFLRHFLKRICKMCRICRGTSGCLKSVLNCKYITSPLHSNR